LRFDPGRQGVAPVRFLHTGFGLAAFIPPLMSLRTIEQERSDADEQSDNEGSHP
jgi:hypothetical protein